MEIEGKRPAGAELKKSRNPGRIAFFLAWRLGAGEPKIKENTKEIQKKTQKMEGEWLPPALAPNKKHTCNPGRISFFF